MEINSKQRAYLMGLASKLPTMLHVGKNGVNDGVLAQIDDLLTRRELVKVGVLKNSETTAKDLIATVCEALGAVSVHAIGSKMILYRYSTAEGVVHVPLSDEEAQKQQREQQRALAQAAKAKKVAAATAKPYVPPKKHGVHKGKGSKPKKPVTK